MPKPEEEEELSDEEYEADLERRRREADEKAAPLLAYFIGVEEAEDPEAFAEANAPLPPEKRSYPEPKKD